MAGYTQLQGKELSYNNIADADAAWECVKAFEAGNGVAACVIVKHANPCGVAIGTSPLEAYKKAFATDPTSAFVITSYSIHYTKLYEAQRPRGRRGRLHPAAGQGASYNFV